MNLLLVDDEVVSVQGMLQGVRWERCGIDRVFAAYTVKDAKRLLLEEPIDLALLDIEMPEENGMDLLRWMRSQEKLRELPCAFLTCHAEFDYAREALQLRCVDYLLKPLEYTSVEELVLRMVSSQQVVHRKRQMEQYGEQWLHEKVDSAKEHTGPVVDGAAIAEKTADYIVSHLSDKLSVEDLAFRAHLNPDYLNRIFKKAKGISINKFIINERMSLAMELITHGGLSATAAAREVGYQNYANFMNMFKKVYGKLPSQLGEKQGGNDQ